MLQRGRGRGGICGGGHRGSGDGGGGGESGHKSGQKISGSGMIPNNEQALALTDRKENSNAMWLGMSPN